jgi:hypothetical protein
MKKTSRARGAVSAESFDVDRRGFTAAIDLPKEIAGLLFRAL